MGEGDDGVGDILTEDHHNVPGVSDEAAQHGVGDLLDLSRLQVLQHPLENLLVIQ